MQELVDTAERMSVEAEYNQPLNLFQTTRWTTVNTQRIKEYRTLLEHESVRTCVAMIKNTLFGDGIAFEETLDLFKACFPSNDPAMLNEMFGQHLEEQWKPQLLERILDDALSAGFTAWTYKPHQTWGAVPVTIELLDMHIEMTRNGVGDRDFRYRSIVPATGVQEEQRQKQYQTNADMCRMVDIVREQHGLPPLPMSPPPHKRAKTEQGPARAPLDHDDTCHIMGTFPYKIETIVFERPHANGEPRCLMATLAPKIYELDRIAFYKLEAEARNLSFVMAVSTDGNAKETRHMLGEAAHRAAVTTTESTIVQATQTAFGATPNALKTSTPNQPGRSALEQFRNQLALESTRVADLHDALRAQQTKLQQRVAQAEGWSQYLLEESQRRGVTLPGTQPAADIKPRNAADVSSVLRFGAGDKVTPLQSRAVLQDYDEQARAIRVAIHNAFSIPRALLTLDDESKSKISTAAPGGPNDSREQAKLAACKQWAIAIAKVAQRAFRCIYHDQLIEYAASPKTTATADDAETLVKASKGGISKTQLGTPVTLVFYGLMDPSYLDQLNNMGMIDYDKYRELYARKHHFALADVLDEPEVPFCTSVGHPLGYMAMAAQAMLDLTGANTTEQQTTQKQTGENQRSSTQTKSTTPLVAQDGGTEMATGMFRQIVDTLKGGRGVKRKR